ncbi:MAG: STAS domain-containing protein [Actinomycetota bacterium]
MTHHRHQAVQERQERQEPQVARYDTDGNPLSVDLVVTGEVDLASVDQFRIAATRLLTGRAASALRVDLSAVTFIDAAGVGALITIRNAAGHQGKRLVLISPAPCVRRILTLTQLTDAFDVDSPESHSTFDHQRIPND